MIDLTRLNGSPLVVNCDLIKYVESSPDTTLTLVTGEKIVVRESCTEVIARAVAYRRRLLQQAATEQAPGAAAKAAADSAGAAHSILVPSKAAGEESNPPLRD
jgi:flagellar protein FlbD